MIYLSELPKAPVARLMKKVGAAKTYAHHAGRKTVKADDVKLALK